MVDLHGDVVAQASRSETASKPLATERPTEYGVPTTTKPGKYSWLGGNLLPTELASGVVAMGARSYVPEIGRFLQPDPMPGGTDNPYAYTNGDPVNETDLTGAYVENDYLAGLFAVQNQEAIEAEAAREAAAREKAERHAEEAAWEAAAAARVVAEQATIAAQNQWDAEAAAGPTGANPGGGMTRGEVLWEAPGGGCNGQNACAEGFLGIKVDFGNVEEWWKEVKQGFDLIKETYWPPLQETLKENKTVCKVVGYAGAVGTAFIPASKFGRALGIALGIGTTYAC